LKKAWLSSIIGAEPRNLKTCAVLFSGGIDSTTALYWALERYDKVFPLTFDYGQRHRVKIRMAGRLVRKLGLTRTLLKVDLSQVGGSALTDPAIPVPRFKSTSRLPAGPPTTYVPFRNGIFLALAAAWAEARRVRDLVCGFHVIDSPDYPDTRRKFVRAMERAINLGTAAAFGGPKTRVLAPFLGLSKVEIIRRGLALRADYSTSVSCYAGWEVPCRTCSSCLLRDAAWKEVGRQDPLIARLRKEGRS
jgi:7-cyano-7-deazaguanine synthase